MSNEELKDILQKHIKWLNGERDGEKAKLYETDLRGANLYTWQCPIVCPEEGSFIGFKKARVDNIDIQPTVDAVPLHEIYRVIAGHSNYHGDNILAALTCVAEGREVAPVQPIDAVEVVRCKDCRKYNLRLIHKKDGWCMRSNSYAKDNDFCSYGERK